LNIHKLKDKKKNINKELGFLYDKKRKVIANIKVLEEAKLVIALKIDTLRHKNKKGLMK
jgi:hypothetical protein